MKARLYHQQHKIFIYCIPFQIASGLESSDMITTNSQTQRVLKIYRDTITIKP